MGAVADAVVPGGLSGHPRTLAVNSATANPAGPTAKATAAARRHERGEGSCPSRRSGLRRAGGREQLVEDAVGQEPKLDAVEHAHEEVDHARQSAGDLREPVQSAAAAEVFGVMRDRFEAQDAFALVYALSVNIPTWTLKIVRFHPGFSITIACRSDSAGPGWRCGRPLLPNTVRTFGTSSRERVRSTIVLNSRSISAPEVNARLRPCSTR